MSLYNVLDLNDVSLAASVPKKWDGIIQYKLRQLSSLQSAMDSSTTLREPFYYDTTRFITKYDRYYTVRWNAHGQMATIHRSHILWLSHNQSPFHGTTLKSTHFQLTLSTCLAFLLTFLTPENDKHPISPNKYHCSIKHIKRENKKKYHQI